jgi:hypothetical protein
MIIFYFSLSLPPHFPLSFIAFCRNCGEWRHWNCARESERKRKEIIPLELSLFVWQHTKGTRIFSRYKTQCRNGNNVGLLCEVRECSRAEPRKRKRWAEFELAQSRRNQERTEWGRPAQSAKKQPKSTDHLDREKIRKKELGMEIDGKMCAVPWRISRAHIRRSRRIPAPVDLTRFSSVGCRFYFFLSIPCYLFDLINSLSGTHTHAPVSVAEGLVF